MIDFLLRLIGLRRAWVRDEMGRVTAHLLRHDPFGEYVLMMHGLNDFRLGLKPDGTTDNTLYPEWRKK